MRPLLFTWVCATGLATAAAAHLDAQALADTAPGRAVVTARVRALAGCYQLALGPWEHAPAGGPTALGQRPPEHFRLDTRRLADEGRDGFAVDPAHISEHRWMPARWTVTGDSVDLVWSTGFTGVHLHLGVRGDTLAGRAVAFTDVGDPTRPSLPAATARAVRTRCPGGRRRA